MICATYRHNGNNLNDVPDLPDLVKIDNITKILEYADPIARYYGHQKTYCNLINDSTTRMLQDPEGLQYVLETSNSGTYANFIYYAIHCNSTSTMEVMGHLKRYVDSGGMSDIFSSASVLRDSGVLLTEHAGYNLFCPLFRPHVYRCDAP